ncbi:DegT/DnrJ/EryC1/StrS family aminotransferase [Parenemella sanctibonifatiensis]|uniref:PLP-dependent aminotransferase n=1 Tax=Parenemella sanctibonifatiensis TaxID=2016505 RepID=A0A255EQF7_9ACTN|nr:DegT/DnrJ/EryC1/StrS family aminotransferase [Parenemella sanctibonifatiensis]OYN90353.1 PLP-dependent aminotransferase [Parenemella sanctibonifatiensis]
MTIALEGGTPTLPENWAATWPPKATPEQRDGLLDVLDSGKWGSTAGERVDAFAKEFGEKHGGHGVATTNGTIALTVAMVALGLEAGDEVIIPSYTFVACATAAQLMGVVPVIADIDPDHFHLSRKTIEAALSDKTKAIMAVHIAGAPAPMDEILAVAKEHDLRVIEDSAQAHGAAYNGQPVGSHGDVATFSFQSSKAMTAGEGGILVAKDKAVADRCWSICNVGRVPEGEWYGHHSIGWNLRMTEFQAALLHPWLADLDAQVDHRNQWVERFTASLPEGVRVLPAPEGTTRHSYHLGLLDFGPGADKAWILQALAAENFPVAEGYPGLAHMESITVRARVVPTPNADERREQVGWIVQTQLMSDLDNADLAAAAVTKVMADPRARQA